jgi:glycosyltransferase involved in cell wall biosynthesis
MVLLHAESNTGYAISPLEKTFFLMALELCDQDASRVHFAYPSIRKGGTTTLPRTFGQIAVIDANSSDPKHMAAAAEYVHAHGIELVFGFDQPVRRPIYSYLRRAGVRTFVSYWGAPISSLSWGVKLLLKRIDVALSRHGPDHFIFESEDMRKTAVNGRGIAKSRTAVVPLGVDTAKFRPSQEDQGYIYQTIGIPRSRKIFFYSGHMEPRKGVAVIMRAANLMAARRAAKDWHVVLFGNQPREEDPYLAMLSAEARSHVTFGGYRDDIPLLHRGCYAGIIASTGWDSLTYSAIEIQSSGLPLIASNLAGLRETVDDSCGFTFKPDSEQELFEKMSALLENVLHRETLASSARQRVLQRYSQESQLMSLVEVVRCAESGKRPSWRRST